MPEPRHALFVCSVAAGLCLASADLAIAQDQEGTPPQAWSNSTELSWVVSTGNSDTNTFGLRNVYKYSWSNAELSWEAGVVRAESRDGDRFALGTEDDFEIVGPDKELDTNRLYSKLRYLRTASDYFFWYVSYDSARDEPSNIDRQFIFSGGVGNAWYEREGLVFRTSYGATYADEELDLEGANRFGGYRLLYTLQARVTASTEIESELTFDGSFQTIEDTRLDALNSVTVSINDKIALKASLRLLFRNIPALEEIDLENADGATIGEVVVPKEQLDTTLSTSLVINF